MKMKPAITISKTLLVAALAAGLASAQRPSIIQNTRNTMNAVNSRATAASNQALGVETKAKPQPRATVTPSKVSSAVKRTDPAHQDPFAHHHRGPRSGVLVVVPGAAAPAAEQAPQENNEVAGSGGGVPDGVGNESNEQAVVPDSKYSANGRRDPFISPVVSHAGGSGCSTGKKCLEIGAINLRGVVRSESGFIAVVSNGLNKAYFLRENDPVFNGYVVKITGDSIVFHETLQDRLGKSFTREVTKKITTPAV
ncbi:MAG: hypothetical protein WAK29_22310 [Terriglobales bacterium]